MWLLSEWQDLATGCACLSARGCWRRAAPWSCIAHTAFQRLFEACCSLLMGLRVGWPQELLVSPHLLVQHSIPVVRVVQYPGEFIINYPGAP